MTLSESRHLRIRQTQRPRDTEKSRICPAEEEAGSTHIGGPPPFQAHGPLPASPYGPFQPPPNPPLPKPALPAAELAGRALHCELTPAPLSKAAASAAAAAAGMTPSQSTLSAWLCFDTIRAIYPSSSSESLWRVACGRGVTFPTRVGRIDDSDNQSFSTTDARTRTHARTHARARAHTHTHTHTYTQARGKIKVPQAGKRLRFCWYVRFFAPSP